MSSKKSKSKENNENLCPFTRKRIKPSASAKSTPHSSWKLAKFETASSPSALTVELLEEMGIGMLDSEESSSSAASAIALAVSVSGSADENSNEATPNLDAPKLCHQRLICRSADNSLDTSTETVGNNSYIDSLDATLRMGSVTSSNSNNNNNNNAPDSADKVTVTVHKKVAILGAGAGIIANSSNSSLNGSPGKNARSPLATVTCNSYRRSGSQTQQQQVSGSNSPAIGKISTTPHAIVGGTTAHNTQRLDSPSAQPSTSQQAAAALMKQQQHQHLLNQQQLMQQQQPRFVPDENFFLFRNRLHREHPYDGKDHFTLLSDEILLQIFKWLPKKALLRCSLICRRFNCCASDESLWARLDLGGRTLRAGALENILTRGVVILRLAQAELNHPVFEPLFLQTEPKFESKLQFLDLSMISITKPSLKMLLSCCRHLKKLSLEHVPINDDICTEIARNTQLEALNVAMCVGLEAWSVRKLMDALKNLNSLNISWTNLSVDAVTSLVTNVTPNLLRLNVAGCRKTMFDSHLCSLAKRCPQLLELDLSDCTALTGSAIGFICKFKTLEYLSLSRCYLIPVTSYMDLSNLTTLTYLDVFGMLSDTAMEMLERNFPSLGINKFIHSSVARPTVGTRRTSIWGLRTRD